MDVLICIPHYRRTKTEHFFFLVPLPPFSDDDNKLLLIVRLLLHQGIHRSVSQSVRSHYLGKRTVYLTSLSSVARAEFHF